VKVSGVSFDIDWREFVKNSSFDIPCVDPEQARREVQLVTGRLGMNIHTKVVIKDGVRALRVWRI
jgi:hypothetical protein